MSSPFPHTGRVAALALHENALPTFFAPAFWACFRGAGGGCIVWSLRHVMPVFSSGFKWSSRRVCWLVLVGGRDAPRSRKLQGRGTGSIHRCPSSRLGARTHRARGHRSDVASVRGIGRGSHGRRLTALQLPPAHVRDIYFAASTAATRIRTASRFLMIGRRSGFGKWAGVSGSAGASLSR